MVIAELSGDLAWVKKTGEFSPLELPIGVLLLELFMDMEEIVKNLKKKSGFLEVTEYRKFLGTEDDINDEQELYGTC
jgi:hypothetical protein